MPCRAMTTNLARSTSLCSDFSTRPIAIVAGGVDAVPVVADWGALGRGHDASLRDGSIESFLFERIDGTRTIAELAALCALSPREVLHLVTAMVLEGAVEIVAASSVRATKVAARSDAPPAGDFVDFSDVLEEVELEAASIAARVAQKSAPSEPPSCTPAQPRVTMPVAKDEAAGE